MRTLLILLAAVALATSAEVGVSQHSLSSAAVRAIENMRDEMPCGFPEYGIPPLTPLVIAHKEVDVSTPEFQMKGTVSDFTLNGLDDFDIDQFKINALTSKVSFRFIFNNVNVETDYDLALVLKKYGLTVNAIGKGPAQFAIKDMTITGSVKYSFGIMSGKLKLKTLNIRTHIGDVESNIKGILGQGDINEHMNELLAEMVQTGVNQHEEEIADKIETTAVPIINAHLAQMNLSGAMGGGGSGSGSGTEGKEKCNVQRQ